MTDALAIRKEIKSRKPVFKRQGNNKKVRLGKNWRKPRGMHSKLRLCRDGHASSVTIGWGSPKATSGLHQSGLAPVSVHNTTDIAGIDPKTQGAIIGSDVGLRKRLVLIDELAKKNITILNIKDSAAFKAAAEKDLQKRKERKNKISKKRDVKPAKEEKKSEEKKTLTEEEKKEQQRKEAEKVLRKRER